MQTYYFHIFLSYSQGRDRFQKKSKESSVLLIRERGVKKPTNSRKEGGGKEDPAFVQQITEKAKERTGSPAALGKEKVSCLIQLPTRIPKWERRLSKVSRKKGVVFPAGQELREKKRRANRSSKYFETGLFAVPHTGKRKTFRCGKECSHFKKRKKEGAF